MKSYLACCILIFAGFGCSVVQADLLQFNVVIDAAQEVPTNSSTATGTAIAVLDSQTGGISINGSFTGMTSNVVNAHLHGFSAAGANSGVLFGLTFTPATSGTFSGSGTIAQANINSVINGLTYINIHSTNFPGGEIRGQLINPSVIPEPTSLCLLGIAGLGLVLRRKK